MIHEIHLEKKHAKSTHSLFLGSYPKFRDSFGSVDENFNVNEFFKKIISRSSNHLLVSPMIITRDKKLKRCSSNKVLGKLMISDCERN